MAELSERIKKIRKDHAYTQIEFAEQLGVTNAHISKLEKGITVPSDALIKLICKVFEVNEEWLRFENGPVYVEDLDIAADNNLDQSNRELRKLLHNQSPIIRWKTSQIEKLVGEIISIDSLDDQEKLEYLNIQVNLFDEINRLMSIFKENTYDKQMRIFNYDIKDLFFHQKGNIDKALSDIMDFFVEKSNEKTLNQ